MDDHVYWKDGALHVLDQRLLPFKQTYLRCSTLKEVVRAINDMAVRGAPLIGIVAAYGMVVGLQEAMKNSKGPLKDRDAGKICRKLKETRPTAVNLFWALNKMRTTYGEFKGQVDLVDAMLQTALEIHTQDVENNRKLARYGSELIDDGDTILTHCNAGALATGGYGTALGVIRAAFESGKDIQVIATETRPYFQGARLTAWELREQGIDVTIVPDNHAGLLCQQGVVDRVIVGADRIARNGDVANKIGTYMIALSAHENDVPFYVAAPLSSFDENTKNGDEISIEERDEREVKYVNGRLITRNDIHARYYGFDITPARLITYIITESGVIEKPFGKYIKMIFSPGKREHHNGPH
ncbi:MAG: Methylthioribose-1-phosphate isomerase [Syntrophorhabdaceae bacterium PtaU1.Bin034]|nr:MAG: Methylthioribose-1-phosphate isomerase [Syntrophorhabdaceae bacterium PtaU1.Bin034]